MEKGALTKKMNCSKTKILVIRSEKKFAKCYTRSILLYGCETWTLTEQDQ